MTWNEPPKTWDQYAIVRAADMNTELVENMLFLKSPPFNSVMMASIVNTTSTSFVEITGASIAISTQGGNLFIAVCGIGDNSTSGATDTWDIAIDGVRQGNATTGLASSRASGVNYADCINMTICTTTPPSVGSHTISAHWKVSAGTGSALVRVFALEILGTPDGTWTAPKTWIEEEHVTADELNTHMRENMTFLRNRPYDDVTLGSVATSSTSFVELTGSDATVVSQGGNFIIFANGTSSNTNVTATFYDLAIDGTRVGDATIGLTSHSTPVANYTDNIGLVWFTETPLSAGSHDLSVHWKVGAGTATALNFRVYAWEIR
jgi:hypothetical protein